MKTNRFLLSAFLITICLTGAVQSKKFIGTLRTANGDLLAEQDGKLVLFRAPDSNPRLDGFRDVWSIDAPYLQAGKGKLLTLDQTGDGVKVRFSDEKSEAAKWGIEVLETIRPKHPTGGSIGERHLLVGQSGSRFRLIVSSGRYQGWYLAMKELTEEQSKAPVASPVSLDFLVVENPKQALTFSYVDSKFEINHK